MWGAGFPEVYLVQVCRWFPVGGLCCALSGNLCEVKGAGNSPPFSSSGGRPEVPRPRPSSLHWAELPWGSWVRSEGHTYHLPSREISRSFLGRGSLVTQFLRGLPGRRAATEHSEVKEGSFFSESQSQRVEACNDGNDVRRDGDGEPGGTGRLRVRAPGFRGGQQQQPRSRGRGGGQRRGWRSRAAPSWSCCVHGWPDARRWLLGTSWLPRLLPCVGPVGGGAALRVAHPADCKLRRRNSWLFILTPVVGHSCGLCRHRPLSFSSGTVVKFHFTIRHSRMSTICDGHDERKAESHVKEVITCGDLRDVGVGRIFSVT